MNLLFTEKYVYTVYEDTASVQDRIRYYTNKKWYDFSTNIAGRMNDDNSFMLKRKWTVAYIGGNYNSPAYLNGKISEEAGTTKITVTISPDPLLVLLFYVMGLLFFIQLFRRDGIPVDIKLLLLLFFLAIDLALFGLIKLFKKRLRKDFGRILNA